MKKYLPIIVFFGAAAAALLAAEHASALNYTLSVPIPGYGNFPGSTSVNDPAQYIKFIYAFSTGFGALLAIIMIVIGAVRFSVSEAIPSKEAAKEQITNAIWGLVLLLGAYVIGTTINPKIDPKNPTIQALIAPSPPPITEICNDGVDNDNDTLVDSDDPDCSAPSPTPGAKPSCSINASPQSGPAPLSSTINWGASSQNPPLFCADPNGGNTTTGFMSANLATPNTNQTFSLQCYDNADSCSASVTVTSTQPAPSP